MLIQPDAVDPNLSRAWRVGGWLVRAGSMQVLNGDREAMLDRSTQALLLKLLETPGRTVDKEHLLAAGWPGRVVSENSLAKAIGRLRLQLDDPEGTLVRVVHGFGYQLDAERVAPLMPDAMVGPGTADTPSPTPAHSGRPRARIWSLLVPATIVVLAIGVVARFWPAPADDTALPPKRLLILPSFDGSSSAEADRFLTGFILPIEENLDRLPQVEVLDRARLPSADPGADPLARARAAGADAVFLAGMVRDDTRFRVSARLLETASGGVLWANNYEHPIDGLLAAQDQLAREIVYRLELRLSTSQLASLTRHITQNPKAYERYVFARAIFADDETGNRRSLIAYQEAVDLDPTFYEARVELAALLGHTGLYADSAEEALQGKRRARDEVDKAIALHPTRPDAYYLRADLRYAHWWDWQGALDDLALGVRHGSDRERIYLHRMHRLLAATGRMEEALQVGWRTQELHPTDGAGFTIQAYHLLALGRFDESERSARQAMVMEPTNEHAPYYLGLSQLLQGHPEAAIRHFEDSAHALRLTGMAIARHELGDAAGSDQELDTLVRRYGHILPYQAAEVHAWRGEADAAFAWFDKACDLRDASLMYLLFDPLLAPIHDDPRFAALARRINLPATPLRTRFPVLADR